MRTLTRCTRWAFICPAPGSKMGACIEIVWLEGAQPQVHTAPYARVLSYFAMGKHLTADELDSVQAWRSQGISTLEIHRRLQHARATGGGDGPNLSAVRRALRGVAHRRGMVETCRRRRTLSPANIRVLNSAPWPATSRFRVVPLRSYVTTM